MNPRTAIVQPPMKCRSHRVYLRLEENETILDIVDCRDTVMRSRPDLCKHRHSFERPIENHRLLHRQKTTKPMRNDVGNEPELDVANMKPSRRRS